VIIRQPEREDKGQVRLDSAVPSIIFRAMSVTSELRRRVRAERSLSRYEPCLPSPAKHPPAGSGWIHEIKHDGFRIIAQREVDRVRLITRNGHDFSGRFPLIVAAIAACRRSHAC
jgi:ATP-dependent DNA ligase